MSRIEEIKQRLERNKKWEIKTEEGYVPTVTGEYKHSDVEWLIEQAETLERLRQENKVIENASDIIGEGFLNINPQDLTSICLKCGVDLGNCICKDSDGKDNPFFKGYRPTVFFNLD
jgi:hypothetical protein